MRPSWQARPSVLWPACSLCRRASANAARQDAAPWVAVAGPQLSNAQRQQLDRRGRGKEGVRDHAVVLSASAAQMRPSTLATSTVPSSGIAESITARSWSAGVSASRARRIATA